MYYYATVIAGIEQFSDLPFISFDFTVIIRYTVWTAACGFRFEVNFGQRSPWFPPPADFLFPQQVAPQDVVRGMLAPATKAECEVGPLHPVLRHRSDLVRDPSFTVQTVVHWFS